jgi:hypothetical protein
MPASIKMKGCAKSVLLPILQIHFCKHHFNADYKRGMHITHAMIISKERERKKEIKIISLPDFRE